MESVPDTRTKEYQPNLDFLRIAAATPEVIVGDIEANTRRISDLYDQACESRASLVVTPELSLTGYSLGDLVQSPALLRDAETGLRELAAITEGHDTGLVVGLPLQVGNGLYNCAALVANGRIHGIVPKSNLPTYKEFYEKRWYQSWDAGLTEVAIGDEIVPFGSDQLFDVAGSKVGIEICEDLWVPDSPNVRLSGGGATVIVNPSASPEIASKADYRRRLVSVTAGKLACAYVYAGADSSESTMDIVMSGHAIISEAGRTLAERHPFSSGQRLTMADIDVSHLKFDRLTNTNYANTVLPTSLTGIEPRQEDLRRELERHPFIPHGTPEQVAERCDEIMNIQAVGLAERLRSSGIRKLVLGLSGGLDSTLALLIAERAARHLAMEPGELIETLTMPSRASSARTQDNAVRLAEALNVPSRLIPIANLTKEQLYALEHTTEDDVTYQNTQARIRTALLFNRANQSGALVLGTGDLSEIALGWCTFGGDHLSHYNVNASIPKTLVRSLVTRGSELVNQEAREVLADILDTPISPELTGDGSAVSQMTEDIVGPYELHDFFLYHFVRFQDPAEKISYLAKQAFEGSYSPEEIDSCLEIFLKRFYGNQWKRSVMPDGPKVGTVSLSPRGDWRMPSDAAQAARRQLNSIGVS